MSRLIPVALLILGLIACQHHDFVPNEEACKDWLDASVCGSFDFTTVVDCDEFADESYQKCDISGYFDCLAIHTTCDEALGIATIDTEACVAEKACDP